MERPPSRLEGVVSYSAESSGMTPEEILRKRREQASGASGSPNAGAVTTTVNNPISAAVRPTVRSQ